MAVFDSGPEKIPARNKEAMNANCVVVANESLGLFETFGVEKSWTGFLSVGSVVNRVKAGSKGYSEQMIDGAFNRMPAHFLVKPVGEVMSAHYAKNAGDHIPWDEAAAFIRQPIAADESDLQLL